MATDNEQQGEIVLGNKQLLSIFFVMAVLLGVAFTIGYMIGKNTNAVSAASTTINPTPVPTRRPVEPTPDTTPTDTATDTTPPPVAAPPPPRRAAAKPATPVTETKAETPAPTATITAGPYLQVAALKRQDAEHIVKVLRDRGYPALLGESPKEGLFRVLVGPFKDMVELHETKGKLKSSGFDSILAR